ncbi:MAG: AAA family ATPase [Deltaproteobacteria bacterium]|nr:AAA family ATPase [Deltaproteobacteria bacterium]
MNGNGKLDLGILSHIDPSALHYQEWLSVGMVLKDQGYTASQWDAWSQRDSGRYKAGECYRKWDGFHGSSNPVTAATIVQLAKEQGWMPQSGADAYELEWDAVIGSKDEKVIIDRNWIEGVEVVEPDEWDPIGQLVTYLETLFEAGENVGYVTESWEKDGKYLPSKGAWDRTAGELIQALAGCKGDIGAVIGDIKPEVGAWIRFNPLDGKGVKNENVTDYRYALVESDDTDVDRQHAIIKALELPAACLVHSGGKSLHAIVKIEAATYEEYRKRVDYLYNVCSKNGLKIDSQNRNPSRLSRMPGVMRNGRKQFLVGVNTGRGSWAEWYEWIEGVNDDLPEPEALASVWDKLPDLSPPLIAGVLRQGHKMLLAGPSKAGKSYALIELCIAIAEGRKWLDWICAQGKAMYVNLELDRASCLHRFKDVYGALGWDPANLANIDIWNLRGKAVPMDRLAPKLIRRAQKKNYIAIVIDPIYKVITGDENSADQMANFCNQFDRVCAELGAAVIYCHHHSKGQQGGKRSMDRASGSGVFARDPDTLLDLIELDLTEDIIKQQQNNAVCKAAMALLEEHGKAGEVSQDDACSQRAVLEACKRLLDPNTLQTFARAIDGIRDAAALRSAWRIDGTLREFPKFAPVDVWFDYPIHRTDAAGALKDAEAEGEGPAWKRAIKRRKPKESKAAERKRAVEVAYEACGIEGEITVEAIAEYMGVTTKTVKNRIKEHGGFEIDGNVVGKKKTS